MAVKRTGAALAPADDRKKLEDHILKLKGGSYLKIEKVQEIIGSHSHARLHAAIAPLVEEGILEPTKSARRSGPAAAPLFEKYRIVEPEPKYHDLTELDPLLVSTGYLEKNPKQCDRWWIELKALSSWLQHPIDDTATLRERCWEVFENEKAADGTGLSTCVRKASGHELRELLCATEEEPEDLPLFVREGVTHPRNVVVSENRDPFLAIRRGLARGATTFFDTPIDAVVWGAGDRVRQSGGLSLMRAMETMHAAEDARVYYWGDIDREGLSILVDLFEAGLAEPLEDAYAEMLETTSTHGPRVSPDGRGLTVPDISSAFVSPELAERIGDVVYEGGLLPQEAFYAALIEEAMR